MENGREADAKKIMQLLDVENNFDTEVDMDIQAAIQAKLLQVVRYKAGLPVEEFGYYSSNGNYTSADDFHSCFVPHTLRDYVNSEKSRINYFSHWIPAECDFPYHYNIFSVEIDEWVMYLFNYDILDENGRCNYLETELMDEIENIRSDIRGLVGKNVESDESMNENRHIANLAMDIDFCFSGLSGPITKQAHLYLEGIYLYACEMLTRDEIREFHSAFYTIFSGYANRWLNIVSSRDVASYYKYRHLIPDSDPRKQIAEKAVYIFLNPLCDSSMFSGVDVSSYVIKHPNEYVVIYTYVNYDWSIDNDLEEHCLHPFYFEVLQIIDNLLLELEQEYAGKGLKQAV